MALPYNFVPISVSPTNGKYRAIEVQGINIRFDISVITIITLRHFYSSDPTTNTPVELTTTDYPPYYHNMIADNEQMCNPNNGLVCYQYDTGTKDANGNEIFGWKDVQGTIVTSPIGLFDFFKPYLSEPVAIMTLITQNVTTEDQIYGTWNK